MPLIWENVKLVLDILYDIGFLIGVPTGLYQFDRSIKKEQRDREYAAYDALDQKYIEFQKLCFEHPRLDIADTASMTSHRLTAEEQKQELIAFDILISLFERAFLMFRDQSTEIKEKQWSGWKEYIRAYCQRENFRKAWPVCGKTFDRDFQNYMEELMASEPLET